MFGFFEEKKFDNPFGNPLENFLFAPWVKHLISTYIRFMVFKITTQVTQTQCKSQKLKIC